MGKLEMIAEETAIHDIIMEYNRALMSNGAFNTAHEGYAVILEELDELWEEVKKKARNRDSAKMYKEAVQIAAMGMRFAIDICLDEYGKILDGLTTEPQKVESDKTSLASLGKSEPGRGR